MKVEIYISGRQGCGKTRFGDHLARILRGFEYREQTEVRINESTPGVSQSGHQAHRFLVQPAPVDPDNKSRETWAIVPIGLSSGCVLWSVRCGGKTVAEFYDEADAELFMKIKTAPTGRRKAAIGALDGQAFQFNGSYASFCGGQVGWPTPRAAIAPEFAWEKDCGAEMLAAIHGPCPDPESDLLAQIKKHRKTIRYILGIGGPK